MKGPDPKRPFPNPVRRGLKLLDVDYRLRRFTLIEHLLSFEQQKILDPATNCDDPERRFAQCVRLRRSINELYAELNNYLEDRRSELIIDHRNMSDADLLEFIESDEMNRQIERTVDDLDDPLRRSSRDGRQAILAGVRPAQSEDVAASEIGHHPGPDEPDDRSDQPVEPLKDDLLLRVADAWINFGDYDQLILPLADIAANKFGAVDAVRISPLDATGLVDETAPRPIEPSPGDNRTDPTVTRRKLGGNALAHFGGFIDADWRLNDITWGRFDTAEVLVRQIFNGSDEDVKSVHDVMLRELAAEVVEVRRRPQQSAEGDENAGEQRSPLDALLAVNAQPDSELHRSATAALDQLRACPLDDAETTERAIDNAAERFGLLLRGADPAAEPGADPPWSVDLSASPERRLSKKLALNQGATLLGRAVALSDDRRRPSRVVAGWLTSASLRLTLPRTGMEKAARHGLPVALLAAGALLFVVALVRQPAGALLGVAAIAASFYAVYARARAFGARYNGSLWRGIGAGAFVGSVIGLAAATVLGAGSAGLAALAVVLAVVGVVMWASLRWLEQVIQRAGHPKTPRRSTS
jgi:hypothetical protein